MARLSRGQRDTLIDMLAVFGKLETATKRQIFLDASGLTYEDEEFTTGLDLSGGAREFASTFYSALEQRGALPSGTLALVLVIRHMQGVMKGHPKRLQQLKEMEAALSGGADAPLGKPVHVSAFFANPPDSAALPNLRAEEQKVRAVLARRSDFDARTITATRLRDLTDALDTQRDTLSVFHYSGHADDAGIWLEGEDNSERKVVRWRDLADELRHLRALRLVLLNGCRSMQEEFLAGFGAKRPAIVAMAAPIGDARATIFAQRFYESLAAGDAPRTALDKARNALNFAGYDDAADIPQMEDATW